MKKLLLIVFMVFALIWGLWFIALPEGLIVETVSEQAGRGGLAVEVEGFKKGLFYNFVAERISIKKSGRRLLLVSDVSGRLDLLRLPLLKAVFPFEGAIGGGRLSGRATIRRRHYGAHMTLTHSRMEELDIASLAGIRGTGIVSAEVTVRGIAGDIKFSVKEAKFEPITLNNIPLPLNMFHTVRGAASFRGRRIDIKSLSFEGEGIFARAKGTLNGGAADMTLEVMPEGAMDTILSALISAYRVSPGYYEVPIKGPIGR